MRWLGLALLCLLAPAVAEAQRPSELERAFSDPAVAAVALVVHRAGCDRCVAALPGWRRFAAEHRKSGLRIFALVQDPSGRCAPPPLKVDGLICEERGSLSRALGSSAEDEAIAFGFDSNAPLAKGRSAAVQSALEAWMRARPRLDFEVRGDTGFIEAFRAELAAMTRARSREGATGAIAEDVPCGRTTLPSALWLRVQQSGNSAKLTLAPKGGACLLDRQEADFDPRRARASASEATAHVLPPWPVAASNPTSTALPPAPGPRPSGEEPAKQSLSEGLRAFAERWRGTRHRLGATGLDGQGIDGPHFVDRAYRDVLGVGLGTTLTDLYAYPGETFEVPREGAAQGLQPGDLLFFTSHADEPRQVMLYLGGGEIAHSLEVRGVVIEKLPSFVPDMMWLVAKRPRLE